MIDLHVHTTASDGALSPREVVRPAVKEGLNAIANTDLPALSTDSAVNSPVLVNGYPDSV